MLTLTPLKETLSVLGSRASSCPFTRMLLSSNAAMSAACEAVQYIPIGNGFAGCHSWGKD